MRNLVVGSNGLRVVMRGPQVADSDIELLHTVYELRIATIDHLAALSGRGSTSGQLLRAEAASCAGGGWRDMARV